MRLLRDTHTYMGRRRRAALIDGEMRSVRAALSRTASMDGLNLVFYLTLRFTRSRPGLPLPAHFTRARRYL